jgi:Zn-finger in ubiquitin-hydrolases and other protein
MCMTNITAISSYRWMCFKCGEYGSGNDALVDSAKRHAELTGHTVEHIQATTLQPATIGQSQ